MGTIRDGVAWAAPDSRLETPRARGAGGPLRYVLITPARNEEAFIAKTLESVIGQTVLPERWVIVDDGSTDRTSEIVAQYALGRSWIEHVRLGPRKERHFAGKVLAFNAGLERVKSIHFQILGNLDADISLEPDHFEFLLARFAEDSALGVAGTAYTQPAYDSLKDSFEGENHVAGALQLFRSECFLDIGGYVPNRLGAIDWIAVTTARMKGWETRNFKDRRFHHYRSMGTAERSAVQASFDYGVKDYLMGGSPLWQVFRSAYRALKSPVGGVALFTGFTWGTLRRMERPVTPELMAFHRREQMTKLKRIIGALVRLKRIEKYATIRK